MKTAQKIKIPASLVCVAGVNQVKARVIFDKMNELCSFDSAIFLDENRTYEEYNRFIVYDLAEYIHTSHALIIQDDGFIINPSLWRDDFLNYDYIGAIWPIPNDPISYRTPDNTLIRVGNGGFSLRSKKLLKLAKEKDIPWKSNYGFFNEDVFICCHNRSVYEDADCKFATEEVAKTFSTELVGSIDSSFGFHGKHHLDYITHNYL
jgi:hypothetical protein